MVLRMGFDEVPPAEARFALIEFDDDAVVYASTLAELEEQVPVDGAIGLQIGADRWRSLAFDSLRGLHAPVLVTFAEPDSADAVVRASARVGAQSAIDSAVVRALASLADSVTPATVQAAHNTVRAWQRIVARYGVLNSREVADRVRSSARNRAGVASDLVAAGRLLAVRRGVSRLEIPDFQFAPDGSVIPVVADVLCELHAHRWSDISIAIWAAAPSGWLGDKAPADVWGDPEMADAVRHAAHQDAAA